MIGVSLLQSSPPGKRGRVRGTSSHQSILIKTDRSPISITGENSQREFRNSRLSLWTTQENINMWRDFWASKMINLRVFVSSKSRERERGREREREGQRSFRNSPSIESTAPTQALPADIDLVLSSSVLQHGIWCDVHPHTYKLENQVWTKSCHSPTVLPVAIDCRFPIHAIRRKCKQERKKRERVNWSFAKTKFDKGVSQWGTGRVPEIESRGKHTQARP